MPRPPCCRRVARPFRTGLFKPAGVPLGSLDEVHLGLDELEAIRLVDVEGLYQEEAARRMGVSRATLGRIVEAARRKVGEALIHGRALRIEGGEVHVGGRGRRCPRCAGASGEDAG